MVLWPRDESRFRSACSIIAKLGPKIRGHDSVPAEPTVPCTHKGICGPRKVTDLSTAPHRLPAPLKIFAVFTFLTGLIWLLPTKDPSSSIKMSPSTSNFAVIFIAFPLLAWYLILSWISVCRHTIYSTPLSRVIRHDLRHNLKLCLGGVISIFKSPLHHGSNAFLGFDWVTLDCVDQVAGKAIKTQSLFLYREIVAWLLRSLHHDQELERFLEGIHGFYNSDSVKRPAEVFNPLHTEKMPCTILSFMHRALSSAALPIEIKQKRIRLSLEVM